MASEPHDFARRLRKSSTKFEDLLWRRLRRSRLQGAKFKRQVPFDRYVVDFYCHAARLVVEVDGAQHDRRAEYDAERTKALESAGVQCCDSPMTKFATISTPCCAGSARNSDCPSGNPHPRPSPGRERGTRGALENV